MCICEEQIENIIATVMRYPGDTHGWHVDDFPLAFVIALEMPRPGDGGELELRYSANEVRKVVLDEGDAYILRSDRIAHRVVPLTKHSARIIINLTYSTVDMQVIPNGTAPLLCT